MDIKRRDFIKIAIALPWLNQNLLAIDTKDDPLGLMVTACSGANDNHYICCLRLQTLEYKLIAVDQRGHDMVCHPKITNQVVMPARRPGNMLSLIDIDRGELLTRVYSKPDRHFYGHCCYTADGRYLLTTENDYAKGKGVITLRDTQSLKVQDEFDCFGIGPHDIQMLPGDDVIVVANGGILTHPDSGRRKLNLGQMKPSLTYIELKSFKLLDQHHLYDNQLSIRHIDINADGDVGIATQHQARYGGLVSKVPLIGIHKSKHSQPELIELPESINKRLNRYTADFCFCSEHSTAAITSPRGNFVVLINTKTNKLIRHYSMVQPSAVCLSRNKQYYVISTATGEIHFIDTAGSTLVGSMTKLVPGLHWDNHMTVV